MGRRSKQDWQKTIKEQAKSGVSHTQFCKARDINPKYFSLLKSKHASKVSPFINGWHRHTTRHQR
jgi:hypothetical protein